MTTLNRMEKISYYTAKRRTRIQRRRRQVRRFARVYGQQTVNSTNAHIHTTIRRRHEQSDQTKQRTPVVPRPSSTPLVTAGSLPSSDIVPTAIITFMTTVGSCCYLHRRRRVALETGLWGK